MTHSSEKPAARAFIHIGTEKTGSSTLQHFLGRNRERLLDNGIIYPRAAADQFDNHIALAAYAADDEHFDDLRRQFRVSDPASLEAFRRTLERDLREELAQYPGSDYTLVFSNEHCQSRLSSTAEIQRVADLVKPLAREIRIVVYLRRQDLMAVSLYSTYLRAGGTRRDVFPEAPSRQYFDFEQLLNQWASVFGDDAIVPRIYEPGSLLQGDVVVDMMALVGLEVKAGFYRPPRINESFSVAAQEIVRQLNERDSDDERDSERRRQTIDRLVSTFSGPGRRPPRAQAQAFYEQFAASNESLRRRWFPDRSPLFDEDFSRYPETDDLDHLSWRDAADLVLALEHAARQPNDPVASTAEAPASSVFTLSRSLFRKVPISDRARRRMRDLFLKAFFPERLDAIYEYMNAPYRGDKRSPDLRDRARLAFRRDAEQALSTFLDNGEKIIFPRSEQPTLSVLIVVYNQPELTFRCLRSLCAQTNESIEVILVDNASDKATRDLLSRVDGANILLNDKNVHYIEGVNGALDAVRGEYLLLLNNDTVLEDGCLQLATEVLGSDPSIGGVGPQVLSIDGLLLENGCAITADGVCHALERGDEPVEAGAGARPQEVDYVSGCFLLTRTQLLREAGGLDCRYAPAYYDDVDFCTLLWEQGYRVVVDPRARITHFESAASSSEAVARLVERNRTRFRQKYDWRAPHQARMRTTQ